MLNSEIVVATGQDAAPVAVVKAPEKVLVVSPMQTMLELLAGPWTLYLVWTLVKDGPSRFGELRRQVPGISSKVLTERLRMLEREGFVNRRYERSVPPQVTYEATGRLFELETALKGFYQVAAAWYPNKGAPVVN